MTSGKISQDSIHALIYNGEWDRLHQWFQSHPEAIRGQVDPSNGSTILHAICFMSSSPESLVKLVVDTWPEALIMQDKRFGATPLHVLCWSSQRSTRKVEILLGKMHPKDIMIRNRVLGSTPLHSACGNNAELPVIEAIVKKHPPVLLVKTFDQRHTALTAMWHSHLQTIPGHMQIARILNGESVEEEHFDRFWKKCTFLSKECFKLSSACPNHLIKEYEKSQRQDEEESEMTKYVLHGMLDLKAPLNMLRMAIKVNPSWARFVDEDGNNLLHLAIKRRPFRVKDFELIREILIAYPGAAAERNVAGDLPIHIAIRDRMVWEEGLGQIVEASSEILEMQDLRTNLYPFLLAATSGGRVAVNTTFQLLRTKPCLIKYACDM